jgi:hypothetical protein
VAARRGRGWGEELVAGGEKVGDVAGGVDPLRSRHVGMHLPELTGEGGADAGGVGVGGYPEAGGRVHDPPIMPSRAGGPAIMTDAGRPDAGP